MTFSVDNRGLITSPNLHDGFVDGILLVDDDSAVVSLRDVDRTSFSMRLNGVKALACNDFRLGNIILGIQIVSGFAPMEEAIGTLFVPPHPSAAKEFHDRHSQFLKVQIDKIARGSLTLVTIDPSYGCTLMALCREVHISSAQ